VAKKSKKDFLYEMIEPEVTGLGYECYDVDYEKNGKDWILTVYIDKPEGISLEDCETVSRHLSPFLDEKNPIETAYTLEVSSPGLERTLKRVKHFTANVGNEIDIRLFQSWNGEKKLCCLLKDADETGIIIENKGDELKLGYDEISKASLHFEF